MGIFSQRVLCRSWQVLISQGGQTNILSPSDSCGQRERIQSLQNGKSQCQLMFHSGKCGNTNQKRWFRTKEPSLPLPWAEVCFQIYPFKLWGDGYHPFSKKAVAVVVWNPRCFLFYCRIEGGQNVTIWCWIELIPKAKMVGVDICSDFCQISAEPEDDLDLPLGAATWCTQNIIYVLFESKIKWENSINGFCSVTQKVVLQWRLLQTIFLSYIVVRPNSAVFSEYFWWINVEPHFLGRLQISLFEGGEALPLTVSLGRDFFCC